jgi:predicted O-methyltransferase YrrM
MTKPQQIPDLAQYYRDLGLPEESWHVGPEHPSLNELGIRLVAATKKRRILEIGVQSGGFAVPVILSVAQAGSFSYVGVDNREYTNAVPLQLIADYLKLYGITHGVRFIEGDSTTVLRTAERHAFDFILLDHYKPKYPFDLLHIFRRDLLSDDGVIVLHDVLTHAAREWEVCTRLGRAFGYTSRIDRTVVQGAGIIRRAPDADRPAGSQTASLATRVIASWQLHAAVLRARRSVGRTLRVVGLR